MIAPKHVPSTTKKVSLVHSKRRVGGGRSTREESQVQGVGQYRCEREYGKKEAAAAVAAVEIKIRYDYNQEITNLMGHAMGLPITQQEKWLFDPPLAPFQV
jgi:hypothetical protein